MKDIVLSFSAISTFKRCRKAYQIGYDRRLSPAKTNQAVEDGLTFHALCEAWAKGAETTLDADNIMHQVFRAYQINRPLPQHILSAEEPLYTPLLDTEQYRVWLRTTFDLLYREGEWIVARDYKTTARAPSYDYDLDFQGRIYIAALMRHYKTTCVKFEYETVRRTAPCAKWGPEECYWNLPLIISKREADSLWGETQAVVRDILSCIDGGEGPHWYRQDLKAGPHACGSCFYRSLCQYELENDTIDDLAIELLSAGTREEPVLPESLKT